jgi:hypothetical protein
MYHANQLFLSWNPGEPSESSCAAGIQVNRVSPAVLQVSSWDMWVQLCCRYPGEQSESGCAIGIQVSCVSLAVLQGSRWADWVWLCSWDLGEPYESCCAIEIKVSHASLARLQGSVFSWPQLVVLLTGQRCGEQPCCRYCKLAGVIAELSSTWRRSAYGGVVTPHSWQKAAIKDPALWLRVRWRWSPV